jgi:hypothetical protein
MNDHYQEIVELFCFLGTLGVVVLLVYFPWHR